MKLNTLSLVTCLLVSGMLTGCAMSRNFTNPFGNRDAQTLPSMGLRDDIQYVPGPDEQVSNPKQALEQYKLEQEQGETTQE